MNRLMDKALDIVREYPILLVAVIAIVGYTLVEVTAIIVLHHTVNF